MDGIPINIKIPESVIQKPPVFKVSSVRCSMGLELRIFKLFTSGIRGLIPQYLDESKKFREQDQGKLKNFRTAACEMFPFVVQYEDAWPVEWYAGSRLDRTSWEYQRRRRESVHMELPERRQSFRVKRHHPSAFRDDDEANSPAPRSVPNVRSRVESTRQDRSPIQRSMRGIGQSVNSHYSTRAHEQPESCSTASTSTANAPSPKKTGFDGVETFLAGLTLNLVRLAPKFSQAGIVDRQCLHALALMLRAEQDMLLKEEMGLNAFERVVVYKGLTALNNL